MATNNLVTFLLPIQLRVSSMLLVLALQTPLANAEKLPVVALDAGHTPQQSGARAASGKAEHEFNVRFVNRLQTQLMRKNVTAKSIPTDLKLTERATAHPDASLLLSIHHDSVQPKYLGQADNFRGYSLFVSRKQAAHRSALVCARHIANALRGTGRRHTEHHAEPIPGENRPWADRRLGIYYFDDLILLRSARKVPAVLLEIGVIAGKSEEQLASNALWIDGQAEAVASGVAKCLKAGRAK